MTTPLHAKLPAPARNALADAWAGVETVILDSPPGAGKTEAVSRIAPILAGEAGMSVTIASPTVAGAYLLAARVAAKAKGRAEVVLSGGSFNPAKSGGVRVGKGGPKPGQIVISTVASRAASKTVSDLLIVDEAYQGTALDVRSAAAGADQMLLVGDPGQIGPVIPFDASGLDSEGGSPAWRAPDVFRSRRGAAVHHLEASWRLGPDTVAAVAALYPFSFASARPATSIDGLAEIRRKAVSAGSVTSPGLLRAAVDAARGILGRTIRRDGEPDRIIEPGDVAIIATRNEQTSILASMVAAGKLGEVAVGTADLLQGAEYEAVVAIDPLAGASTASGHAAAGGRLCVMTTRHRAHLTFVTTDTAVSLLDQASEEGRAGVEVRNRIVEKGA